MVVSVPTILAIGIIACDGIGAEWGSLRWWIISLVTVICAMSLSVNFLQLLGKKIK